MVIGEDRRMIDEKKLIGEIHEYFGERIEEDESGFIDNKWLKLNKEVCRIVYRQPKVDEWIPCSERLPEEETLVLCTEKGTGKLYIGWFLNIEDVGVRWFDYEGFSMEVIAWQPLPEPYREEE